VKLCNTNNTQNFLNAGDNSTVGRSIFRYSSEKFGLIASAIGGTTAADVTTDAVFRDFSAWYHLLWAVDTTQAASTNRVKLWVNGIAQQLTFTTAPDLDGVFSINNNSAHRIGGAVYTSGQFPDYYLADCFLIDGQALDPSSFTEVSATTGRLEPKAYSGPTPTGNSFWLPFSDNSAATATTLGKDNFNLGNNWTPNNLSVTAGAGNDSLVDTPVSSGTDTGVGGVVTGNYCTLNPLDKGSGVSLANGNLDVTITTPDHMVRGTVAMPASGKWYFEFTPTVISGTRSPSVGIANSTLSPTASNGYYSASAWTVSCGSNGNKQHNNSETSYASAFAANDVGMCAVDLDNGKIWWGKNGTWFASGNPATGANAAFSDVSGTVFPAVFGPDGGVNCTCIFNFGARSFSYAAPSGYKCLVDTNLPTPVVAKPSTAMDVLLWSGTGGNRSFSSLNMSPDFVWIKQRNQAFSSGHQLYDIVRGAGSDKELNSAGTAAEGAGNIDQYGWLSSFDSNGFSVTAGPAGADYVNASGTTYVAWCFDAGANTVTNTQGSITSSCRTNQSSGFSIATFTAPSSGSATIGHNLNAEPHMIIIKSRDQTYNWCVYHKALTSNAYFLNLNTTAAQSNASNIWNNTTPTSTVFSLGSGYAGAGATVAYLFSPVAGYSSFGSYTGTGSGASGPFVYTGMRPRWLLIKRTDSGSSNNWVLHDTARSAYNLATSVLYPNLSNAEDTTSDIDILSNGFRIRDGGLQVNASGGSFVYAAFAESPFQYARAR
jgi:hypothetical protein